MSMFALALAASVASPPQRALPADVRRFIDRREACDHWRGEDGYDADRHRQIADGLARSCTGVDRALDRLRRAYRRTPRVIVALEDYGKVER